jgi:predicted transcriptional regulator
MSDSHPQPITELFYLVASLISTQHQLSTIPHDLTIAEAVEYMEDMGFSQLPVKSWNTVIGVFSYRSFCRSILEIQEELDPSETIGEMIVGDFIEQNRFVNEDDNWESILRYLDSDDCVLIGNRENLSAIVTPMDVIDFLYRVAKPFVVIAEIELSIRRMITNCVDDGELQLCIHNSLSQLYSPDKLPTSVTEMNFNDYVQIIGDGRNWEHFEPFFGNARGMRKRTRNYLNRIGELRNDIFHFRRSMEDEDLRFLNNKRDLLQNKARIFEGEQRRVENEAK